MLQTRYSISRNGKTLIAQLGCRTRLELRLFEKAKPAFTYGWIPKDIEVIFDTRFNLGKWARRDPDSPAWIKLENLEYLTHKHLRLVMNHAKERDWLNWRIYGPASKPIFEMRLRLEEAVNIFEEADRICRS